MSKRKLDVIYINGKAVMIELESVTLSSTARDALPSVAETTSPHLPKGAEETGIKESVNDLAKTISTSLEAVVGSIGKGLKKAAPDEWTVELSIGFAAENDIKIPYISSSGKVESGIKITAKWINKSG